MSASMPQADVGVTPRPDPTVLTTQALRREIESLDKLITSRLDAMDKAQALFEKNTDESLLNTDTKIAHLKELLLAIINERASSVENQFEERDVRQRENAAQVKLAVDAALQAAKEAVAEQNKGFTLSIDKSETATAKQIDSLGIRLTTATQGLESQIADVKERLVRLEATGLGRAAQVIDTRAQAVDMRGTIMLAISLVAIAITVAGFVIANS